MATNISNQEVRVLANITKILTDNVGVCMVTCLQYQLSFIVILYFSAFVPCTEYAQ